MSYILGLTGGIGCGKSAASDRLKQKGITIVDADTIARQVVEPDTEALQAIAHHFGATILTDSGALNREKLREIIFNHPHEKQWLEALLHPIIRSELLKQLKQSNSTYTVLSAPLLLENNLDELTDSVLVIDCDEELQINRVAQRDNSNMEQVKNIMGQQISREQRLKRANTVIANNGSLEQLYNKIDHFHNTLLSQLT